MAEEESPVMGMIFRLAGELLHRKMARHNNTIGGAQRPDVWLVTAGGKIEAGIRLAIDFHLNAAVFLFEPHLCVNWRKSKRQDRRSARNRTSHH